VYNFYIKKENEIKLKFLIFLLLIPLMLSPIFAQNYQVSPTDEGTIKVGISTTPINPVATDETKFKIDFINPKSDKIQEHIDYKFTLQRDGKNVFGPTDLIHTSEGSVTIPVGNLEIGTYFALIEIEGILFQPIPAEFVSFSVPIGDVDAVNNGTSENGGGCLIATATYGSEMSSQVQQLRELRDNVVLNTKSGKFFMTSFNQFYYSFSPSIADYERENSFFKEMVKVAITPLVTSLSILNYIEIDSEEEMLGYGFGLILLNAGIYFALPAIALTKWYQLRRK
jgi:hypothetical protein